MTGEGQAGRGLIVGLDVVGVPSAWSKRAIIRMMPARSIGNWTVLRPLHNGGGRFMHE